MKKLLHIAIAISGATIISGAGVGLYFAMKDTSEIRRIEYEIDSRESDIQISNESSGGIDLNIVSLLSRMIESSQFIGPEQGLLNKVIILNDKSDTDASYNNESNEIFINSRKLTGRYKLLNNHDKAYYMYQLFIHEYFHHIANVYLKNVFRKADRTREIHAINTARNVQIWPRTFVEKFKEYLIYNNDSKLYSGGPVREKFVSVGSLYNQKNLFDLANGSSKSLFPNLANKNAVMSPANPAIMVEDERIITPSALEYIYSLDELFSRKYMVLEHKYKPTINTSSVKNQGFNLNGFMNYNGKQIPSAYLEDILNFRRDLNSIDGVYLQDNPFANERELEVLRANMLGKENLAINFISFKNTKHFDGSRKTGQVDKTKIMFGGNISVTEVERNGSTAAPASPISDYKYFGYFSSGKFEYLPIRINTKMQLMGVKKNKTKIILRNNFYTVGFFDIQKILGKSLFLSKDFLGNSKVAIKNINKDAYNGITTFTKFDANASVYTVVENNGLVSLNKIK